MTQLSLAMNRFTPARTLLSLVGSEKTNVKLAIVEHSNCPVEALVTLAKDSDNLVRHSVAVNVRTPLATLRTLLLDSSVGVRAGVASNPSLPPKRIASLTGDDSEWIRISAIKNPSLPLFKLRSLLHGSIFIPDQLLMLHDSRLTAKDLARFVDSVESLVRLSVVMHPACSPALLARLSTDEAENIRGWVADHPSTSVKVLNSLVNDPSLDVRVQVAANPKTPLPALLALIAVKPSPLNFAYRLARNPNFKSVKHIISFRDHDFDVCPELLDYLKIEIDRHRKLHGLEGVPDSWIEKALVGKM